MFTEFVQHLMKSLAQFERIRDSLPYYGYIKGYDGVWAQGKTRRECEQNLREVLEEWLLLKIRKKQVLPSTREYDINTLLRR